MIVCDICNKTMSLDADGDIPRIVVSGFWAKDACHSCKWQWKTIKDNLEREQQNRQASELTEAFQTFCKSMASVINMASDSLSVTASNRAGA